MKRPVIVMGAGAIGRGYLPWVLDPEAHPLVFVDADPALVARCASVGRYATYRVRGETYERREVVVAAAYTPDTFAHEAHPDAAACFLAVGPRHVAAAASRLRGSRIPLILCENDPDTVAVAGVPWGTMPSTSRSRT